ncbi:MAG: hypothetical protein WCL08_00125 [Verrucomicrobiota bacterium]
MSAPIIQTVPISSLPVQATPTGTDLTVLLVNGVAKQAALANLRMALDVATEIEKGLMSATDKGILDLIAPQVAAILAPTTYTIASAATISVPTNATFVVLTGTVAITNIIGLTTGHPCDFYYPTGIGLTFLGNPVQAGDAPLTVIQTAS